MNNREKFEAFLVSEYEWAEGALNAAIFCGDDATGHYVCGEHIYDRQDCSECLFWAWRGWQAASKASEQQLSAVVAENAGLKSVLEEIINADQPEYHDQGMGCGVEDRGYQSNGYSACYYGWESAMDRIYSEVIPGALPETPATDAAIANIQAQGVDAAIEHMQSSGSLTFGDCYISLHKFAAQLRQGAEQ